ncbi:MAG: hypothetical protein WC608_04365 [Parcubacteria group bacterium]
MDSLTIFGVVVMLKASVIHQTIASIFIFLPILGIWAESRGNTYVRGDKGSGLCGLMTGLWITSSILYKIILLCGFNILPLGRISWILSLLTLATIGILKEIVNKETSDERRRYDFIFVICLVVFVMFDLFSCELRI